MAMIRDVSPDTGLAFGGSIGVAALVGIAAIVVALLMHIKRSLIEACPVGLVFHHAEPWSYPQLDTASLDRYSDQLEQLGFVWLANYTISAEKGTTQPGFARLFAHTQHGCYAEVNQLFPTTQSIPVRVVLGSRFSDGWIAATTDRTADAAVWLLRRPKNCWQSVPGESVSGLLDRHLQLCRRIHVESGARLDASMSAQNWYDAERRNAEIVRETIRRRNIVALLWEFFTYTGRTEWLGGLKTARSNARNDYN